MLKDLPLVTKTNFTYFNFLSDTSGEWNKVLFESDHFVVLPTLGMIVEGWLLISPKRKMLNFSMLSNEEWSDFKQLKTKLEPFFTQNYITPTYFEHGPNIPNSVVGCGVDYAHMHVAPLGFNLIDDTFAWNKSETPLVSNKILKGNPYLFVEQDEVAYLTVAESYPSQSLRKIIASKSGLQDCWDWKTNPFLDNIQRTIITFNSWKETHQNA